MVRLIKKDKLSNKNESYYIKEGKQVGKLYHVCTLDAFVNHIIEDKNLGTIDNLHASKRFTNDLLNTEDIVSFTRDSSFVVPTDTTLYASILFQIVVDGNKLSEHHKIYPYQDLKWTKNNPKKSEKEEVVLGDIPNFKSYIKEVHFDIKSIIFNNTEKVIEYLEKVKDYLGSIECTRVSLPYKVGDGGYKKTASWVFSINTLDELIDRLNSNKNLDLSDIDTKDLFNKYFNDIGFSSLQDFNSLYKRNPKLFNKSVLNTLLFETCNKGNLDLVKLLLEHGADVNSKDNDEKSSLSLTCDKGNLDLVKLLLEHGADVSSKNKLGVTPLEIACRNNNIDLVKLLFNHGADVNGDYLLFETCNKGNLDLVKLLLEHGADPNVKNRYNETPLFSACNHGNLKLVKLLLEHDADVNIKNKDGDTLLYTACYHNNIELVKLLLEHGAWKDLDVNNLPYYITDNEEIEELVLSYLNKNKKTESIKIRRLYRL